jgi:hypothetical protein
VLVYVFAGGEREYAGDGNLTTPLRNFLLTKYFLLTYK